jgi:hypothetical protein
MTQKIKLTPLVQKFLDDVTYHVNPDFEIKNKAHPSGLYRLVSALVSLFNKRMDTEYITIINGQCWLPGSYFDESGNLASNLDEMRLVHILAHETLHEHDRKRLGTVPFSLLYLLPQVLAVFGLLSLLAFWDLSWLWCLLFFLFLAPIPAPGRAWIEIRGYKTNMSLQKTSGWIPELLASEIYENYFGSPDYYFMMPFKKWVIGHLVDFSHEQEEPYMSILKWHNDNR